MIAYAITDPSTLHFQSLTLDIERFSTQADMLLYRDKLTDNYASNAKLFIEESRKYMLKKVLLHGNYILAKKLKADGVHLTSTQFSNIKEAKALGLFVVISTHTEQEAKKAESLGADMVTYSPIFSTPNKGEPKGIEELKHLVDLLSIPVIALGGITSKEQIDSCESVGAFGFASIRYFKDKSLNNGNFNDVKKRLFAK
jgi:thiamine-phosphate pyrophosphorylase